MKKRFLVLFLSLMLIIALGVVAIASVNEETEITITYLNSSDNINGSTSLDKVAYEGGVQTVKVGEKFVLPTTSGTASTVEKGYTLVWYTKDGRAYDAGATVSFTESTELYSIVALNVSDSTSLASGLTTGTYAARLTSDITTTSKINTAGQNYSRIFLNGHTINVNTNEYGFAAQRGSRSIMGEGKVVYSGTGSLVHTESHFYNGHYNTFLVGRDVTIEAPKGRLAYDANGDTTKGYPKLYIYGDVTAKELFEVSKASGEKNPEIYIYDTAEIVVTECLVSYGTEYKYNVVVNIDGGKIDASAESVSLFSDGAITYNITKGELLLNEADKALLSTKLAEGYQSTALEINGKTYDCIVSSACEHDYQKTTFDATCTTKTKDVFTCSLCGEEVISWYGEFVEHSYTETNDEPATPTTKGIKEYTCDVCGKKTYVEYSYDPSNLDATVVVDENGTKKEVIVKASEVFEFVKAGEEGAYTYVLSAIKAFGEYELNDIVEVVIPAGIAELSLTQDAPSLTKITIPDGSDITLTSFSKLSALTEINIGRAKVVFSKACINSKIQAIHSDVAGADITFEDSLFYKKSHLTELTLCAGSTYNFKASSFRECGLKELIFPDNSTISWSATAFAECQQLKYIYFGSNIGVKRIEDGSAVFDGISYLEKIVVMDLEYFGQWAFSTKNPDATYGSKGDLTIYNHSEKLTTHKQCFNTRNGKYHVYFYTVQEKITTEAYSNCNYEIYHGIPHALIEANKAPTCTEDGVTGYDTDCPCGEKLNGSVVVKTYVNSISTYTEATYTSQTEPATGHDTLGALIDIVYNSFLEKGAGTYACSACGEAHTVENTVDAIFEWLGYSTNAEKTEFAIGYSINHVALGKYEEVTGNKIAYGIVGAVTEKLGGLAPLDEALDSSVKVISYETPREFESGVITEICFRVKGFTSAHYDLGMTMAGYVTETVTDEEGNESSTTVYIQSTQTNNPSSNTINNYLASLPADEEEDVA